MRKSGILAITLLAVLVLLAGMGAVACDGNGEEGAPPSGNGEETAPPTEDEKGAPPTPGEWTTSTEFGKLGFTVNSGSTGISKVSFDFAEFECGGVQMSGGVSVETPDLWPITDGQFTVDVFISPWDVVIEGEFDETGTHASGTWEIDTCSGTWEASR